MPKHNPSKSNTQILKSSLARQLRILIVDDNSFNLHAISFMLKRLHYEVAVAISGQEALKIIEESELDLIFMDVQMPVLDGIETTKRINLLFEENKWEKIPIIALTANGEQQREECLKAGMSDFVQKPIKEDEIKSKIMKWIKD